jgi:hypothetical protein
MKVFKAPEQIDNPNDWPSVFLAGAIDMGQAEDWQSKITNALDGIPCVVLNPRRDDWDSSWKQDIKNDKFREQVEWELDGMVSATYIAMCLTKDSKAPISLLELGLHATEGKMVVFCPEGFYRKGNVDIVCKRYHVPVYGDFEEFTAELVKKMALPNNVRKKRSCWVTASDRVASRAMLRAFVTGTRYQDKPHFEIPQYPIPADMVAAKGSWQVVREAVEAEGSLKQPTIDMVVRWITKTFESHGDFILSRMNKAKFIFKDFDNMAFAADVEVSIAPDFDVTVKKKFTWTLKGSKYKGRIAKETGMNVAQELVKVAKDVMAENTGLALDGMSNVTAKRVVNRILDPLTKGFFTDEAWEPVHKIWKALSDANINWKMTSADYTHGGYGSQQWQENQQDFHTNGKDWKFEVYFTNDKGKFTKVYGIVRAAWAGSVSDPSGRYDLVAYVS